MSKDAKSDHHLRELDSYDAFFAQQKTQYRIFIVGSRFQYFCHKLIMAGHTTTTKDDRWTRSSFTELFIACAGREHRDRKRFPHPENNAILVLPLGKYIVQQIFAADDGCLTRSSFLPQSLVSSSMRRDRDPSFSKARKRLQLNK